MTSRPLSRLRAALAPAAGHVLPLDGMRAVAVLMVVAYHLGVGGTHGGWLGVDVFFVLSGYLITGILLREYDRAGEIGLGRFYLRRLIRLYPALLAVILVVALLSGSLFLTGDASVLTAIVAAITYTSNVVIGFGHESLGPLQHTWSLAMEEQFYLLWAPVLMWVLMRRVDLRKLCVALVVAIAAAFGSAAFLYESRGDADPYVYFQPQFSAGVLLGGCLLAIVLHDPALRARLVTRAPAATWVGLVGFIAVVLAVPSNGSREYVFTVLIPLSAIATALLILGLVHSGTLVSRGLSLGPVVWVGTISYSLYLWHWPVIVLMRSQVTPNPGAADHVLELLVSFVAAVASHYLIERPFLKLNARRRTPSGSAPVVPAPQACETVPALSGNSGAL